MTACGCKREECIHVCVERMRLVAAELDAAERVVQRARESLLVQRLLERPAPGYVPLKAALDAYDAAVIARGAAR